MSTITLMSRFHNNVKLTILLALAGIPLVFVPMGGEFDHYYFPKVVAMFIMLFSYLIMRILNFRKVGNKIENDWINKFLLIYFCFLVLSLLAANDIALAIYGSPGRMEGLITITMYFAFFLITRSYLKLNDNFFLIVMATAMIISIYGISQHLGFDPFLKDILRVNWGYRSFSTMGNPNFLGSYLVLMIPISIYFFIINNQKVGLIFYGVLLYCLLATSTRGSWLGAIASTTSFFLLHFFFYKFKTNEFIRYIVLFIFTIIIILLFNFQTDGELFHRFLTITNDAKDLLTNSKNSDYTGAHRGFIWKRVVELIEKRPILGYGLENLSGNFEKYFRDDMIALWGEVRSVDRTHNEYLHIAVSSGIPSLVFYLSFVILILKQGLLRLRDDKYMLLLMSSVLGYMVAAFFNISVVCVAYVYWIFLGLMTRQDISILPK